MRDAFIELQGERLRLMPERCLLREASGTLLAADLHLGKEGAFRALGAAVPDGPTADTLSRLEAAFERVAAHEIVILGDLFHSKQALESAGDAFSAFRRRLKETSMTLIPGSHDRWAGELPKEWGVRVQEEPFMDAISREESQEASIFAYRHTPGATKGAYTLCGHLHPGVVLSGSGGESVKASCFHFGRDIGALPAFGEFTGATAVQAAVGDRIFVCAGRAVLETPGR